jgi:hypothetical protein
MRLLVYAAVIGFTPINLAALGRRFFKPGLLRSVSELQASAYEGPLAGQIGDEKWSRKSSEWRPSSRRFDARRRSTSTQATTRPLRGRESRTRDKRHSLQSSTCKFGRSIRTNSINLRNWLIRAA